MAESALTESPPETARLEIRKSPDAELEVGGLRLVACRREVDVFDGGITLYIWNGSPESESDQIEFVRMDLFRDRPHYHAPAENQAETVIEAGAQGIVGWGIEALTTRAPALVAEAGFADAADSLDVAALAEAGPAIQSLFDGLEEPTEISHFEVPASVLESLRA
jgi:hypothetical protein